MRTMEVLPAFLLVLSATAGAQTELAGALPPPYKYYTDELGMFRETDLFKEGKCNALMRREATFSDSESAFAQAGPDHERISSSLKADVVCIANDIVVTEPIFTNGGDIIIVATNVTVSAPIDTRIYLQQFPAISLFTKDSGDPRDRSVVPEPSQGEILMRLFASYYTGCKDCELSKSDYKSPRLPSGLIGPFGYTPAHSGLPAPKSINFELVRSGSISIYTQRLSISGEREGTAKKLLIAQGADGGLGGAGPKATCGGRLARRFACIEKNYRNSGFSGPGGPGGDAGDIEINFVYGPSVGFDRARIEPFTSLTGGQAGPSRSVRTPSPAIGGAQTFIPASEWNASADQSAPPEPNGAPGSLTVRLTDASSSINALVNFSAASDANPNSSYADLVYRAHGRPWIQSESLTSFVRQRLSAAILDAQQSMSLGIVRDIKDKPVPENPVWPIFRGLDMSRMFDVPALQSEIALLRTLDSDNSPYEFFYRQGGVFSIRPIDPASSYLMRQTRIDLARQLEVSSAQLMELVELNKLTLEGVAANEGDRLRAALAVVQAELARAEAAAQAGGGKMSQLRAAIDKAKGPIASLVAGISSQNYLAVATSVGPALKGVRDVQASITWSTRDPDFAAYREQIRALNLSISALNDELMKARQRILSRSSWAAHNGLRSRSELRAKLDGRSIDVTDYLRHSFVSYANDPSKNADRLTHNVLGVWKLAGNGSDGEPSFQFSDVAKQCVTGAVEASPASCISISDKPRWQHVNGHFGRAGMVLPLYVIAPNSGPLSLPAYGIEWEVEQR